MPYAQRSLLNEIMSTDIFVCIYSSKYSESDLNADIDKALEMFREFEVKYSRFLKDNELYNFNHSVNLTNHSEDFVEMVSLSVDFYNKTEGFFNICVLPDLLREGYVTGKNDGFLAGNEINVTSRSFNPTDLLLNGNQIRKPEGLMIDLGGIGKSYIVNKISESFGQKYNDYIVSAGGDMYVSGDNIVEGYDFWAIDIENPKNTSEVVATLTVNNCGVATSGVNKRKWKLQNNPKNHIIDKTGHSLDNDLLSSTVVMENVIDADIYAKYILSMGSKKGVEFSNSNNIACFLVDKNDTCYISREMEKYVWEN